MNYFKKGDIIAVKPEYYGLLISTYSSGYSNEKREFGRSVARGVPAKVVSCTNNSVCLTDLEETLQHDDYLHLLSDYFDTFIPPITADLL